MKYGNHIIGLIISTSVVWSIACETTQHPKFRVEGIDTNTTATRIPFRDLVKNYKTYQGKHIETTGRFHQAFEEFAIYADERRFDDGVPAFWLTLDHKLEIDDASLEKMNGKLVKVKGIIDTTRKGHLSAYVATIIKIYYWEQQ